MLHPFALSSVATARAPVAPRGAVATDKEMPCPNERRGMALANTPQQQEPISRFRKEDNDAIGNARRMPVTPAAEDNEN